MNRRSFYLVVIVDYESAKINFLIELMTTFGC